MLARKDSLLWLLGWIAKEAALVVGPAKETALVVGIVKEWVAHFSKLTLFIIYL